MSGDGGLWIGVRPLILASGSAARRDLLQDAAVPLTVVPALLDERVVEAPLRDRGASPASIAAHLAEAKALEVSRLHPDEIVLGADQTLALGRRLFTKPRDRDEARRTLEMLSGQTHSLHSAWALARDGKIRAAGVAEARLTMRPLGVAFLEPYIALEGDRLCASVGAYRLEGPGVHLFESIEGDHATILGLPLLGVLSALRELGYLRR